MAEAEGVMRWMYRHMLGIILVVGMVCTAPHALYAEDEALPVRQERDALKAYEDKDYARAAEQFGDAYRQGVAWYKAGEYGKAVEAFREATAKQGNAASYYDLGNALFHTGDVQGAVMAYQQALEEQPSHLQAEHNLQLAEQVLKEQEQEGEGGESDSEDAQQKDAPSQEDASGSKSGQEVPQADEAGEGGEQDEKTDAMGASSSEEGQKAPQPAEEVEQFEPSEASHAAEEQSDEGEEQEGGQEKMQESVDPATQRMLDQIHGRSDQFLRNRLDWEAQQSPQPPGRELQPW